MLTSTAASRITPRNRYRQSVFQPLNWIPMNVMPMISAPIAAPIAEPKPPVSRHPPATAAMM